MISFIEENEEDENECFLTHSLKEELEEVKESFVIAVDPVQRIQ